MDTTLNSGSEIESELEASFIYFDLFTAVLVSL